jgi:hypothetical protein
MSVMGCIPTSNQTGIDPRYFSKSLYSAQLWVLNGVGVQLLISACYYAEFTQRILKGAISKTKPIAPRNEKNGLRSTLAKWGGVTHTGAVVFLCSVL